MYRPKAALLLTTLVPLTPSSQLTAADGGARNSQTIVRMEAKDFEGLRESLSVDARRELDSRLKLSVPAEGGIPSLTVPVTQGELATAEDVEIMAGMQAYCKTCATVIPAKDGPFPRWSQIDIPKEQRTKTEIIEDPAKKTICEKTFRVVPCEEDAREPER